MVHDGHVALFTFLYKVGETQRRYDVVAVDNYGVTCPTRMTTNGSCRPVAEWIASVASGSSASEVHALPGTLTPSDLRNAETLVREMDDAYERLLQVRA
jgi:hypothetical protein